MSSMMPSDSSHHGIMENSSYRASHDWNDEAGGLGSSWYFSRKEIEENSPSRRDGVDLKKEIYLRKSYCTFLQDLGMRLKVPQVTIATAIVFCHRFFLRQSHGKNDRRTIATVCMFLAGKVEETPRPLKDVILVSYEIIHKKDPAAVQRIKQREVYEQQKELILLGERVVLATLGFDLNVHHPYKPLVEAIKKFKVAQNALAQVAWNFVNDGLRTSLCLQFKTHHIAAGAIFLAAKFLKVKLPSDGEKVWWQEFDVTPRQLEEVSNQMLELYEQNRAAAPSQGNETEGSSASVANQRATSKATVNAEESPVHGAYQASKQLTIPAHHGHEYTHLDKQNGAQKTLQTENHDHMTNRPRNSLGESRGDATKDSWHHDPKVLARNSNSKSSHDPERPTEERKAQHSIETREGTSNSTQGPNVSSSMMDAMKKIDKDKVKAALEKRRKSKSGDVSRKADLMDDDDLIERELEHGVELAVEEQERRQSWSRVMLREGHRNADRIAENGYPAKQKMSDNAEEGELSMDSQEHYSPEAGSRKRKAISPGSKSFGGKDGYEYDSQQFHQSSKHHEGHDDARLSGRYERTERDHKRLRPENQGS